ncbi:methyltransferase [Corynebacterium crudilactis]|uniref:rRNA methyltransferase n=1 Tax=Corynebacterium crudilactis TaxID=1652495 RepID=A0A172QU09_9CORY|nr:class I SAM-dependent methyltransferase [Corynebacterium crudilactis]ANE04195.1 rRNA methyltransferase [Corynebacterium crudilactis]
MTHARTSLTEAAAALKSRFREIGYTTTGINNMLGPDFTASMHAGQPAAVRFHLDSLPESELSLALRAFVLRDQVRVDKLASLLGDVLGMLVDASLVDITGDYAQFLIDIRPHLIAGRQQWVFSDADASMTQHVPGPDHVLGVGAASLSLLQATPTSPVDTVLDLGTGSGIQVLGQAGCAQKITATDVHPRALDFAEATLVDSGISTELLEGSWFEPVRGRFFDRIIANPPFVVGPPEIGHVYRDSGMDLDGATALVVKEACAHLKPGGTAHLLGAWVHSADQSWQQRVAEWLPDHGYVAWIIERDAVSPAQYVGTWLADESLDLRSPEAASRTTEWLNHFAKANVTGVGFGFIAIQRLEEEDAELKSDILAESMTQYFEDPLGPEVAEYFARTSWLREQTRDSILESRYKVRPGVAREDISLADAEEGMGFSSVTLRLTRTDGPRWSHDVDQHVAAIVAGLNPHGLPFEEILEMFAMAQGIDGEALHNSAIAALVDLIRHGLVLPADLLDS